MIKFLSFLALLILLISCNKKKLFDGPNTYQDDFEAYIFKEDLIDGNDEFWSFFQMTDRKSVV